MYRNFFHWKNNELRIKRLLLIIKNRSQVNYFSVCFFFFLCMGKLKNLGSLILVFPRYVSWLSEGPYIPSTECFLFFPSEMNLRCEDLLKNQEKKHQEGKVLFASWKECSKSWKEDIEWHIMDMKDLCYRRQWTRQKNKGR